MNRTTNFIVIKVDDIDDLMPEHFNEKYGRYDSDSEVYRPISWSELKNVETYRLGHANTDKYTVDDTEVYLFGIDLEFIKGDFDAACKYGIGKVAPIGQVMSWQEAKEFKGNYGQEGP
jgi:hypothetical protein